MASSVAIHHQVSRNAGATPKLQLNLFVCGNEAETHQDECTSKLSQKMDFHESRSPLAEIEGGLVEVKMVKSELSEAETPEADKDVASKLGRYHSGSSF